jgi:serine/threonine protein kinase
MALHANGRACWNCGHENPLGQNVCLHCGRELFAEDAPVHQLTPGTILAGKYLTVKTLGEGGFGITYLGYNLQLDIKVAIKEYFPEGLAARDHTHSEQVSVYGGERDTLFQDGAQKFMQEARSLARFSSLPGIVSVNDFFHENGTAYIVMKYLEGVTLKEYVEKRGGKIPASEALSLVRPVVESLTRVHDAGIIHRDISPDNVMITDGGAYLIDFGAARSFASAHSMSVLLKFGYAPEEQYRSKGEQGPWTDVYSLCATLYWCITGHKPPEALERLEEDTISLPSVLGATIAPGVEQALMKGLEVYRKNRIQSMRELATYLYATENNQAKKTAEPRNKNETKQNAANAAKSRQRLPVWLPIAGGTALAVVLLLVLLLGGKPGSLPAAQTEPTASVSAPVEEATPIPSQAARTPAAQTPAPTEAPEKTYTLAEVAQANRFTVACGNRHVAYIKPNGTLGSAGSDIYGQRSGADGTKNVIQLAAGYAHTAMLFDDGTVSATPIKNPSGEEPYEYGQSDVSGWNHVVQIEAGWVHTVGLLSDGTVVAAGDNAHGQCDVDTWRNVQGVAAGAWNTAALSTNGRVLVAGDNEYGQCDISWENENIVQIAVGRQFVVGLRADGTVIAAGRNLQNQLAVSGWNNIVAIATGDYHTIGLKKDGTVITTSFTGKNAYGQDLTGGWMDVIAVYGGARTTVGLCLDGTLLVAGLIDEDTYTQTGNMAEKAAIFLP